MKYQAKVRVFSFLVIFCLLLSALGIPTRGALAANAGTALQFNGTSQYVSFGKAAPNGGYLMPSGTPPAWQTPANSRLGNSALSFNGTSQYASFGKAIELGAATFTLEAWFYWTGGGATTTSGTGGLTAVIPLVSKGRGEAEGSNVDMNYILGIQGSKLAADFEDLATGANHPVIGATTITANTWHHAAATYNSTTGVWVLYLDGVQDGTATVTTGLVPRSDSVQFAGIGSAMTSAGTAAGFFAGRIDEVRIWNVVRSQAEIQGSMNSEIPSASGLIGRWGLNEGTGKSIMDSSQPSGLGLSAFTIETWLYWTGSGVATSTGSGGLTAATAAIPLVTKGMAESDGDVRDMNYFVGLSGGKLAADFEDTATGLNHPMIGSTTITTNTWHHVAVTYDGQTWNLYLDGIPDGTQTLASAFTPRFDSVQYAALATAMNSCGTQGTACVGSGVQTAGYFGGVLDETRIWNVARSQADIQSTMNNEVTSGTGLVARWGMNETSGATIGSSVGSVAGNLINAPVWVSGFPITVSTPPTAPSGLTATAPTAYQTHLAWNDNADNESGFEVERSLNGSGGIYSLLSTLPADVESYDDGEVDPSHEYCYRIRAVNSAGPSSYNGPQCVTTPAEGDYALEFDGTNDYVTFGQAPGLGVTDFTLETWFYWTGGGAPTSTSTTQGLLSVIPLISKGRGEQDGSNVDMNYFLGVVPTTNKLAADFEDTANGMNYPFTGNMTISTNAWHHAAVTYNSTTAVWSLYLDGVLDSTSDLGSNILPRSDSIQHAGIGSAMTSNGTADGYFQGKMDEARIWNRALTMAEIRANINAELTSGSGLVARWGMNEGTGATIASTVGAFPGTLTNSPVWGSGAPFNIVFDTTPPASPTNLMASPRPGAVQLEWTANTETDLAGYRIYRGTSSPVVKGTPINGTLVAPSFIDSSVTAGTTYYYAVAAVDSSNNESPLSNETSSVPLTPPPAEALDLGTAHAYVALGDNADTSQFTLETWLRRDGTGVANTTGTGGEDVIPLITNGAADAETVNADINYILGIRASDGVLCADFEEAQTGTAPGQNHPVCGTTSLVNGAWYHAAVTYNGSIWQLYLNGNLERALTVGQPANAANISQLAFGTSMKTDNTPLGFFDGALDEVRIWNYPRTQAQIVSTINTKLAAPQTGLIGRWGLDEASGAAVNDSSGNALTGAITGTGYSWVPGSPFNATINLAPEAPALVTPLDNATNVPTTTTLSVDVSDPENQPLDVTFYGRPLQSAAGPDFTLIVVPDPQYYAATYPSIYNAQMNWIVNNKASNNIVYAASLGDNVDVLSNTTQWTNADAAWDILDAGNVPYGLAAGNHDGAPSGTANFNNYFGSSRFAGKSYYGGHYGSDNDNHYALFTASGLDFIVIFIEYDDSMTNTNHAVLQWANDLLQTHSDRRAIVVSHNILQGGASTSFTTQGQTIYNALKGNANLFLMMGGHLDVAARRTDTFNGNTVHTLRSDYQSVDSQQSGYLRIMRFSPSDDMIYVRTYSPTQNKDYDKSDAAQNNFNLPYAMDGTGFSVIGTANDVPSGETASVNWSGLNAGEQYEWFVIASDGTHQTSSDTWDFTTAPAGNTPPVITEGAATNVTMSEDGVPTAFNLTLHATDVNASDTLTWSISTAAANGTASASGTGAAKVISYVPSANYNGADSFVVQVSDGHGGMDTITVNLTIQPVNDLPVANPQAVTTLKNTAKAITLTGSDVETAPASMTFTIVTPPAHGALTGTLPDVTYTPAANYSGPDSFTFKVNDGTADSAPATVSITVDATNVAPVLAPIGNKSVNEGVLLSFTATATDNDNDTLTYSLDSGNPGGSSINPSTGVFTWTPTAAQGPGSYPITVRVSDGLLSDFETITVTVNETATGTTTTITGDTPDPSIVGQNVSVAVSVASVPAGAPTPTGTVTVSGGVANCTINLVNGAGMCNITFDSVGTKTITATYNPAAGFSGSSDTDSHTVGETTSVAVTIGKNPDVTYPMGPMESKRVTYAGVNTGPVKIVNMNTVPIIGAERVIYKVNGVDTSFTEMMALPSSQLDTTYWLPWYNSKTLDTQLRIANISNVDAIVHVTIGTQEMLDSPYTLAPGASKRLTFANIDKGPVKIESNVPVVAAERVIYEVNGVDTSFSEMMALPNKQLSGAYWLPWYNSKTLDTQVRIANVSDQSAEVHVFISGQEVIDSPYTLAPGASKRLTFANIDKGLVKVESNVDLVVAERVIYKVDNIPTSFSEMMGLPDDLLSATYWLPWYNCKELDTQLRFGVPSR